MNAKTTKNWTKVLAAVVGLMGFGAVNAMAADPNAANNSGNFEIRITPNVDLGVTVDTNGAAWMGDTDLYTDMDLSAEKRLGTGVSLTVAGNFNKQEYELIGATPDTWDLDADETPEANKMRLYALIGANQNATVPASADYDGVPNLILDSGAGRAGQANGDEAGDTNHKYEFSSGAGAKYADVDNMAVGQVRRLWLRANTPTATDSDEEQRVTVTVTAKSGSQG